MKLLVHITVVARKFWQACSREHVREEHYAPAGVVFLPRLRVLSVNRRSRSHYFVFQAISVWDVSVLKLYHSH